MSADILLVVSTGVVVFEVSTLVESVVEEALSLQAVKAAAISTTNKNFFMFLSFLILSLITFIPEMGKSNPMP